MKNIVLAKKRKTVIYSQVLGRIVEAHGEFHLPWQKSDEDELAIWVSKMNLSSKSGWVPRK